MEFIPFFFFEQMVLVYICHWDKGVTSLKELGKERAEKKVQDTIQLVLERMPQLLTWKTGQLDLRSNTPLGKSYELPNIAAKYYGKEALPKNEILTEDLYDLLNIYNEIAEQWSDIFSNPISNQDRKKIPLFLMLLNFRPPCRMQILPFHTYYLFGSFRHSSQSPLSY